MTFDELQKTWQGQQSGLQLSIDSDLLFREVKRNKKSFESAIFWRDVRETSGVPLMLLFCGYYGFKHTFWQLSILLPGVFFVAAFIIIDRIIQKRKTTELSESLASCIKNSLYQINHQIWLLRNVLWWYLLPLFMGIVVFLCYTAWVIRDIGISAYILCSAILLSCFFLYWGIYWLNQRAVRKELIPRKEELEQMLNSLKDNDK